MSSLYQMANEKLTSVGQWAADFSWPMSSWFQLANEQLISVGLCEADIWPMSTWFQLANEKLTSVSQWATDTSMVLLHREIPSRVDLTECSSVRNSIIKTWTDRQTCAILQMLSHLKKNQTNGLFIVKLRSRSRSQVRSQVRSRKYS